MSCHLSLGGESVESGDSGRDSQQRNCPTRLCGQAVVLLARPVTPDTVYSPLEEKTTDRTKFQLSLEQGANSVAENATMHEVITIEVNQ